MADTVIYHQINKDHAYWTEKRKFGYTRGGHTAGLLSHVRDEEVVTSILFDAGLGTIDGLHDLPGFSWEPPLSIFLTHAHIDHHAELMILSELWCKRATPQKRGPIQVHCTGQLGESPEGTIKYIRPVHAFGFSGGQTLAHVPISSQAPVTQGIFTIYAIDVDHFAGAVIYVVAFGHHKILIGWDMKTLPDPDQHPLLKNPSLALLEANTWTALSQRTGHTSVEELVSTGFIPKLTVSLEGPERYGAYLVHFGGGEDPGGAITDSELEVRFRRSYPDLARTVGVARRSQNWRFTV